MKIVYIVLLSSLLFGCAQGRFDVIDSNGKVIGECSAAFDWHWYGARDSVNYVLNLCAQEQIAKGHTLSDNSILVNNYVIPVPPKGSAWNKVTAKEQFKAGYISEQSYGYILAEIEYKYVLKIKKAEYEFAKNLISEQDFKQTVAKAKFDFNGK
jgi:hypothetical protein